MTGRMPGADRSAPAHGAPEGRPRIHLLCFSGAGGNSPVFHDWIRQLPSWLALKSVTLPGHPGRFREKPAEDLVDLGAALAEELAPVLDKPFALFGHSMGALVAFEVARSAQRMGRVAAHLFVSACAAPQLQRRRVRYLYELPDRALQQELMRSANFASHAINRPELIKLMLPVFRADIRLCETYKYSQGPLLRCPVTAYGGIADPWVTYQELAAWSVHTTESFKANMLPGDHRYLNDQTPPVVGDVCQQLLRTAV